jgi:succinate-semialdehyde dehydrogenase/glutarate-semialdehyde dehydrogenase
MPWNFPFWQVFRFAVPTLAAGNTILLKHAQNVFGCSQAIEATFREAGLPKAAFTSLIADVPTASLLIRDPGVAAVTITASVGAGRAVATEAGKALKKCVLELGGSDPFIVLEDADLDRATTVAVQARFQNTGQSCIAAKRFILVEKIRDSFEKRFVEKAQRLKAGNPEDPGTELGPLARADLRDKLHEQVQKSVSQGARVLCGGAIPKGPGAFYPPTVLTDAKPGMPAWSEELFGPVATLIAARDEAEAVSIANATEFGLGASVWTRDLARGEKIAAELIEAGNCFVNGMVKSDPRLPFGGIKNSGYGRELGEFGIHEFVNIKTVVVQDS